MFTIALSDDCGSIFTEPHIEALARIGQDKVGFNDQDVIPIPAGSSFMLLPGRTPLGKLRKKKKTKTIPVNQVENHNVFPAAVVLPPGYTRTLLPCYNKRKKAPVLPFYAYTALAWQGEELVCGAVLTHKDLRWDPAMYNSLELPTKIKLKKKKHPGNRLLDHLERCSLEYRCFTAQNIFYERWEGGIPTSASCNARCVGCISESRVESVPSPQERIKFVPASDEIADLAVDHLKNEGGIISFGQGCEGEPLTRADLILEAIEKTRGQTGSGTLNINTNGSMPEKLDKMFKAGLDSARISLNSAIKERYHQYFQPQNYQFEDVVKSVDTGLELGKYISLNFLYMPGINDREEEMEAFFEFLGRHKVNMIQFRNLNIDPDYYFQFMPTPQGKALGTVEYIEKLKNEFPDIKIGNFSVPVR
ncbi:MAG: radical SAM protein [Vulcanimicrobiota bacterium]